MLQTKIKNSAGEFIVLNDREELIAKEMTRQCNALGYDIDVSTLAAVQSKVLEQKFFEVSPADYIPIRVGNGAWSQELLSFRSFALGGDFEKGVINTGGVNGRLASGDVGVDSVSVKVKNWAKEYGWTLFDLQQASRAGNWDLVTAKEKQRKKDWDLGIQRVAFLGLKGDSSVLGLMNQSTATNNTALITEKFSGMTAAEINTVIAGILDAYRTACVKTAYPTHFLIPESDWLGLGAMVDPSFPLKTKLAFIEEAFKLITKNPNFKVLPNVYGDAAYNGTLTASCRYALYNSDEDSLRMEIPVDYTATIANSVNSFSFQNVGYGQFTGVMSYRPLELMYFSF